MAQGMSSSTSLMPFLAFLVVWHCVCPLCCLFLSHCGLGYDIAAVLSLHSPLQTQKNTKSISVAKILSMLSK